MLWLRILGKPAHRKRCPPQRQAVRRLMVSIWLIATIGDGTFWTPWQARQESIVAAPFRQGSAALRATLLPRAGVRSALVDCESRAGHVVESSFSRVARSFLVLQLHEGQTPPDLARDHAIALQLRTITDISTMHAGHPRACRRTESSSCPRANSVGRVPAG